MDGFESARLKLARAVELAAVVASEVERWEAQAVPRLVNRFEGSPTSDGRDVVARLTNLPPLPGNLILSVDEAVHHLRSALDHAIWQLVEDNGGEQVRQAFPVLDKPDRRALERSIVGTAPEVRAVVESVQPYRQRPPKTHRNSTTWLLHRLDVVSKHRSIIAVWPASDRFEFHIAPEMTGLRHTFHIGGRITDEPEIARLHDVPDGFADPGEWVGIGEPRLWISETDDHVGGPLVEVLEQVARWATKIVDALEAARMG